VRALSRRHVLRGAGVALALPWLESLAPRRARGQTARPRLRFVPIYFPLGIDYPSGPDFWTPATPGAGDAWQLSPILEPFAPVKEQVTVLGHVDQTAFGTSYPTVDPGNGQLTGAFLTCTKVPMGPSDAPTNGVSIDQRIAAVMGAASMQVGLSTLDSFCDGAPCAYSRSVSWTPDGPVPRLVDPQAVFDAMVQRNGGAAPSDHGNPGRKSVLDFVKANAASLEPKLGRSDRARMDQFLTSVRDLETRVAAFATCEPVARPTLSASAGNVPPGYDRNTHADVMIDLIVMAVSCNTVPVISFMLDDARSYFVYDFLQTRHFTAAGSAPTMGAPPGGLIGEANAGDGNDGWTTIQWWFASKASSLCQKLAALPDGLDGNSVLDNSVVWFGSGQQGENVRLNLPLLYVGGGGGTLRTDQALSFAPESQRLSNVYLTFLRNAFGATDAAFGDSTGIVPELLA